MKVQLKHSYGHHKTTKVGYSFTVLFFSFIPPLLRGDWKWALIIAFLMIPTLGLSTLIFSFMYNGIYIRSLLVKGYRPIDESSRYILVRRGYIAK